LNQQEMRVWEDERPSRTNPDDLAKERHGGLLSGREIEMARPFLKLVGEKQKKILLGLFPERKRNETFGKKAGNGRMPVPVIVRKQGPAQNHQGGKKRESEAR